MDVFIVLILGIALLALLAISIFQFDILSPSVDTCALFFVGACFLIPVKDEWGIVYSPLACFYVLFGLATMIAVEYGVMVATRNQKKRCDERINTLEPSTCVLIFICIISLVGLYLYWQEIRRISGYAGNFSKSVIANYRQVTTYSNSVELSEMMKHGVAQIVKITTSSVYVIIISASFQLFVSQKEIKRFQIILMAVPVLCYLVELFLTGGRTGFLQFFSAIVVVVYSTINSKNGWKKRGRIRFATKLSLLSAAFVGFFYAITPYIRRSNNKSFFEYIVVYIGAPLQLFNLFVNQPPSKNDIPLKENLCKLYQSLYKLHLYDDYVTAQCEYRFSNGHPIGNVYTFFRRPIQDMGFIGLIIVVALLYGLFSYIYYTRIRNEGFTHRKMMIMLVYAYFYYMITMAFVDCSIRQFFQLGEYITLLFMYVIYMLLFRVRIRWKTR